MPLQLKPAAINDELAAFVDVRELQRIVPPRVSAQVVTGSRMM